jgi:signal transduction histidine kinase
MLGLMLAVLALLPGTGLAREIEWLDFCVASTPAPDADCDWARVTLPHRWRPEATGGQWAHYRIEASGLAPGVFGMVLSGLSPDGRVSVAGRGIAFGPGREGARYLRYEPQIAVFSLESTAPVIIEIASRGELTTPNGLRAVFLGPVDAAQAERDRLWEIEVLWPLVVAGCALVAGVFALSGSAGARRLSPLLKLLGALGVLVACRMGLNHVTELPIGLAHWSRLRIGLLLIDVLYCLPVIAYLLPEHRRLLAGCAAGGLVAALGLALVPDARLLAAASLVFGALAAAGVALLAWLLARLARAPERVGLMLAACFGGALLTGLLDLFHHLSWLSAQHASFQRTAAPLLLVLILFLLVREGVAYRALEGQLARESGRREHLLQDLHDVVGSRLVALAFRAGRPGSDPLLRKGLDELLRELRMIQQVVRAGPARLDELLADVRDVYGDWSELNPRIVWSIDDAVGECRLTPEQAVATVRILREAIANAMRHGRPETITIRALRAPAPAIAAVFVEDAGLGALRMREHGGLRNMVSRAQSAGLELSFDPGPGVKRVRIVYPGPVTR